MTERMTLCQKTGSVFGQRTRRISGGDERTNHDA